MDRDRESYPADINLDDIDTSEAPGHFETCENCPEHIRILCELVGQCNELDPFIDDEIDIGIDFDF